jgi:glycine hydroxymethyltransferase
VANASALADTLLVEDINLVTDGTDNHLVLLDLSSRGLTGKAAEKALESAGITTNKNMVPNDPQKPFLTSGVRIGTPALTTRGMRTGEMKTIGKMIARVLNNMEDEGNISTVRGEVLELTSQFPLYTIPA